MSSKKYAFPEINKSLPQENLPNSAESSLEEKNVEGKQEIVTPEKKYNFRLVVKNCFGKFKTKGQILLSDEDIEAVINSGNLRNCCKTSL